MYHIVLLLAFTFYEYMGVCYIVLSSWMVYSPFQDSDCHQISTPPHPQTILNADCA